VTKLDASLQAIVDSARERYEDSITCDAVRNFILSVGDVPADAWGQMEWTGKWRQDWATARDGRVTEATTMRDRLGETGAALAQVASDYAHTDLDVALNFDISQENSILQPYLESVRKSNGLVAHPGGHSGPPAYYDGAVPGIPSFGDADTNPSGLSADQQKMIWAQYDHFLNRQEISNVGDVTPTMKARQHFNSPGHAELWKFANEHYETLTQAEKIVMGEGENLSHQPSADFIDKALPAWPQVIMDRADLMHAVARMYNEMKGEMETETSYLMGFWSSPSGSNAYNLYAGSLATYFGTIADQATWLADEGVKAGKGIDKLMLEYARAGYEKISIIIDKLDAYRDAVNSLFGSPENPLQELAAALNAVAQVMLASWKAANEEAQVTLNLSAATQDNAPDLGSSAHGAQPFPTPSGIDGWHNGHNWHTA
jgi:hypothetical protein